MDLDRLVRQPFRAIAPRDFAAENRSDGSVRVADRQAQFQPGLVFECILCQFEQTIVECLVEAMILIVHTPDGNVRRNCRHLEDRRQIQFLRFPVFDGLAHVQFVAPADHFIDRAESQLGHQFANFFRDHAEVIHDVVGLAGELLSQHRVLRGHTNRARVEMADAHHDAAGNNQG